MGESTLADETPDEKRRIPVPPAFKYHHYRNYWLGMLGSVGGYQIFVFGQLWLVHELTGSPVYLGFVGLANALPAITLNLVGGVSADRFERKRLVVITQLVSATVVALLALITVLGAVEPWHVLVAAAVVSGSDAFNQPARLALYPHYVPKEALASAVALNSGVWQGSRIVAPAIAGAIVAISGTGPAFFLAAVGMALLPVALRNAPELRPDTEPASPLRHIAEGLRYIRTNPTMAFLIGMTFFNSFFLMAYIYMMPVFAVDVLDVGVTGQGWLLTASGIGSLVATVWFTTRTTIRRQGVLIVLGAILAGSFLVAFSLTTESVGSMTLAMVLILGVGAFNSLYILTTITSLQLAVREDVRGRVMGFFSMTWSIAPLGGMFAGFLAAAIGAPRAVAIGGLAVIAFAAGPALLNARIRGLALDSEGAGLTG